MVNEVPGKRYWVPRVVIVTTVDAILKLLIRFGLEKKLRVILPLFVLYQGFQNSLKIVNILKSKIIS